MIIYKYDDNSICRGTQWRRYQEDKKVRYRLNRGRGHWWWSYYMFKSGDVEYGKCVWTDLLGSNAAHKSRTSFSYKKSRWDDEDEYNRAKYKRETRKYLHDENIFY